MQAKYIAQSAGLPSGLNNSSLNYVTWAIVCSSFNGSDRNVSLNSNVLHQTFSSIYSIWKVIQYLVVTWKPQLEFALASFAQRTRQTTKVPLHNVHLHCTAKDLNLLILWQ